MVPLPLLRLNLSWIEGVVGEIETAAVEGEELGGIATLRGCDILSG